jgi:hypothetical protein
MQEAFPFKGALGRANEASRNAPGAVPLRRPRGCVRLPDRAKDRKVVTVDSAKVDNKEARDVYRFSVSNVYEIAVASAKEAKRMNERFSAAKKLPPENVTLTAIEKVIGGGVTYKLDRGDSAEDPTTSDKVDGHS